MEADLVVKNGTILTFDSEATLLDEGWLSVKDNKIDGLGKGKPPAAKHTIDATGKVVMPGLINTHTHASMVLLRGLADDLPLHEWLFNNIFPIENKFARGDFVYWGTKLAAAEMLLSGTTTFNDMYYEPDMICKAAKEAGIRAVVSPAALDLPARGEPKAITNGVKKFMEKWAGDGLIVPSTGSHAIYTCSPELLMMLAKLAEEKGTVYHIHLSETEGEVKDSLKKHGKSPVEYLESLGVLSPRVLAAHCVHLSEEDIRILKKHDVKVAHNPESNMKLASGIAPIADLTRLGVCVSIGTDSAASNNNLNMFEALRLASFLQKISTKEPTVIPAKQALDMATIEGARALGLEGKIGSLETGKLADIIIIDLSVPNMQPLYNIYSQLAYSATGSEVETVIVNGKVVVRYGKVVSFDLGETVEKVREIAERIKGFRKKG